MAESTVVEKDGFRIVAGALPEFFPFVVVFAPNGTVAMDHSGDPYCTDVQEMIAIGVKKVDWLCDYRRIAPHQQKVVLEQSVEYIARSFNISLDVAYGWKVLATMGINSVYYYLVMEQEWYSTQTYEECGFSPLINGTITGRPNPALVGDIAMLRQDVFASLVKSQS